MKLIGTCPRCGEKNSVTVAEEDYEKWVQGTHAQNAFPYLTEEQREILISGYDINCWNKMFEFDEDGD